jgi:uncharacterized protein YbaR (Trm112 family)
MERHKGELICETCRRSFRYRLIHSGFNDSVYAYCNECTMIVLLSTYGPVPALLRLRPHEAISIEVESQLRPCPCGGRFTRGAAPRCPYCKQALSADAVAASIEADSPGTAKGWRWQRNWTGLYCVIVENRVVEDNWLPGAVDDS